MPETLVLATRNANKVAELADILADVLQRTGLSLVGIETFAQASDVVETGVTFEANAVLKATAAAQATGAPALGDDSGLAVDVLGGSPGVFSARWAGSLGAATGLDKDEANNQLLLSQLADVPDEHRGAGFVCAAALALPDGTTVVRHGTVRGMLGRSVRGEGGFGYDPLLVLPDGRTMAQLSPQDKHAISHRGQAFRALADDVARLLGESGARHTSATSREVSQ